MTFDEQVDKFTSLLADTLKRKNADYGDSYGKSVSKYGEVVALIRISDKFNRLENLLLKGTENKVDETIPETLLDLCGYAALEVIRREGYDE